MQSAVDISTRAPVQEPHRAHTRALFSVPLVLRRIIPGVGLRSSHGISLDISAGGLGAIVQGTLRLGEYVQIDLAMGSSRLRTSAVVRHTSDVRSGFEFLRLSYEERNQIASLIGSA
jgi:PilZ domain-containing protein